MKKKIVFLIGFVFFLLLAKTASASTITGATIEVSPRRGDITTNIFVHVKGEPYRGGFLTVQGDVPVLYLYYDDKSIVQRMKATSYPRYGDYSDYECVFDVSFKVPNEYPYSELGIHNITARIEGSDGTMAYAVTTFEIVNYIPPPEWWEDLPQEFMDKITGPKGDKGDTGPYPIEAVALNLGISVASGVISAVALSIVYKMKKGLETKR